MTKDGRPSTIQDIRLFYGSDPRSGSYLKGQEEAVAFCRRLAWYLNAQGFSLGSYTHLYLLLTTGLAPDELEVTDFGGEWWHRFTEIGVSDDLLERQDAGDCIREGVVAALKTIRPDLSDMVEHAARIVGEEGEALRVLVKVHRGRRYIVSVSFSIAAWPQTSSLFIGIEDRTNGSYLEAPPVHLRFYQDAFDLVGKVQINDSSLLVIPKPSFTASLTKADYGASIIFLISAFRPCPRPSLTGLVKRS